MLSPRGEDDRQGRTQVNDTNLTNTIRSEAKFVLDLIDNGEWDRALRHSRLVTNFIGLLMSDLGIEPMAVHIHDTTPVVEDRKPWTEGGTLPIG